MVYQGYCYISFCFFVGFQPQNILILFLSLLIYLTTLNIPTTGTIAAP